ncbi:MAG: S9 family peptidase [Desulfobacterales bacterium]|nr:S9 family peptidase [Desulfobacterales bacterium]
MEGAKDLNGNPLDFDKWSFTGPGSGLITASYGSWKSPITSDMIVSEAVSLGQIVLEGENIYWIERRPDEGGRNVVVLRTPDGETRDVNPAPFNARTLVHSYGGGALAVADGAIYFSNFDPSADFTDQRIHRQAPGEAPTPVTPAVNIRYADGDIDQTRGRMICVWEDHTVDGEEENSVVSLSPTDESDVQVLASGNDFYSNPRLSFDGSKLAWLTWNHPNMPWDTTELWVGNITDDGTIADPVLVAGGDDESLYQPEWSPDGSLYFISDRTGWWNLYRWKDNTVEPLVEMEAEFGLPQWYFKWSTYSVESAERIICTFTQEGIWYIGAIDTVEKKLEIIETPYTNIRYLRTSPGIAVFTGSSSNIVPSVVRLDLTTGEMEVLRVSKEVSIDSSYIAPPEPIEFPTENGLTAYGLFYPPTNPGYTAPDGELPPLVVATHGGPTSAASTSLDLRIQYWTSRGIAFLDVNYGGSTGYGREFRERLKHSWGIVDVDDSVNGAQYLVGQGRVDSSKLAIRGGSAGGYTTLASLTFRDVFKAGASYYGVSDLSVLAEETHKFESRYLDSLIGPYVKPVEPGNPYYDRSPIHFTDGLSCPVILFQGSEDPIVPPTQARLMVDALEEKQLPYAYLEFEGEQHGFRIAENIKRSLEAELYFYSRIFEFELADPVEPVDIKNLD